MSKSSNLLRHLGSSLKGGWQWQFHCSLQLFERNLLDRDAVELFKRASKLLLLGALVFRFPNNNLQVVGHVLEVFESGAIAVFNFEEVVQFFNDLVDVVEGVVVRRH